MESLDNRFTSQVDFKYMFSVHLYYNVPVTMLITNPTTMTIPGAIRVYHANDTSYNGKALKTYKQKYKSLVILN
jgi:hypothetical protein